MSWKFSLLPWSSEWMLLLIFLDLNENISIFCSYQFINYVRKYFCCLFIYTLLLYNSFPYHIVKLVFQQNLSFILLQIGDSNIINKLSATAGKKKHVKKKTPKPQIERFCIFIKMLGITPKNIFFKYEFKKKNRKKSLFIIPILLLLSINHKHEFKI